MYHDLENTNLWQFKMLLLNFQVTDVRTFSVTLEEAIVQMRIYEARAVHYETKISLCFCAFGEISIGHL